MEPFHCPSFQLLSCIVEVGRNDRGKMRASFKGKSYFVVESSVSAITGNWNNVLVPTRRNPFVQETLSKHSLPHVLKALKS